MSRGGSVLRWLKAPWESPRFRPRLTATPEADALLGRLRSLGLRPVAGIRLTANATVMVSFSRTGVLSIHRGYAAAPDEVLAAVVRFVGGRTPRAHRKAAERVVLGFRPHEHVPGEAPARRRDRPRPGDAAILARLAELFRRYNREHFGARLPEVPLRVSGRMRTRLGHLSLGVDGRAAEISISRRHVERDGWEEAGHTLLHEMVHLWQHANGHPVDHGPRFRARARAVGVTASAHRWVRAASGRRRPSAARTD